MDISLISLRNPVVANGSQLALQHSHGFVTESNALVIAVASDCDTLLDGRLSWYDNPTFYLILCPSWLWSDHGSLTSLTATCLCLPSDWEQAMNKPIQITLTFEMDEATARLFLQSSIERVINTSIACIERPNLEWRDINLEDWEEWKPVVCSLWNAVHDAVYRSKASMPPSDTKFALRKGEIGG